MGSNLIRKNRAVRKRGPTRKARPSFDTHPLEESLREAFVMLTIAENELQALVTKKYRKHRRAFAPDPWPDDPIAGLLELATTIFDLTQELRNQKRGPKERPKKAPGKPGRPLKYEEAEVRQFLSELGSHFDAQAHEGRRPTVAEAARRYLKSRQEPGLPSEREVRALARRLSYFQKNRPIIPR